MSDAHVRISLLPGTEDPQITDRDYQIELQQFAQSLEEAGVSVISRKYMPEMKPGVLYMALSGFLGEYGLPLAQVGIPAIGSASGVWIGARGNRRVRVKIGDIEVEARTSEEVKHLLQELLQARQNLEAKKEPER